MRRLSYMPMLLLLACEGPRQPRNEERTVPIQSQSFKPRRLEKPRTDDMDVCSHRSESAHTRSIASQGEGHGRESSFGDGCESPKGGTGKRSPHKHQPRQVLKCRFKVGIEQRICVIDAMSGSGTQ